MKPKTARSHKEWRSGIIIGIISYTDLLLGLMSIKVVTAVPIHLKLERGSFISTVLNSVGFLWLGVGTSSYR